MVGHTPGPWRVGDAGKTVYGPKTTKFPAIIAVSPQSFDAIGSEQRKANVRLIAAAPDLLEALHDCLTIVQDEYDEDPEPEELTSWKRAIDAARAAIAKATEQPPVPSA